MVPPSAAAMPSPVTQASRTARRPERGFRTDAPAVEFGVAAFCHDAVSISFDAGAHCLRGIAIPPVTTRDERYKRAERTACPILWLLACGCPDLIALGCCRGRWRASCGGCRRFAGVGIRHPKPKYSFPIRYDVRVQPRYHGAAGSHQLRYQRNEPMHHIRDFRRCLLLSFLSARWP